MLFRMVAMKLCLELVFLIDNDTFLPRFDLTKQAYGRDFYPIKASYSVWGINFLISSASTSPVRS